MSRNDTRWVKHTKTCDCKACALKRAEQLNVKWHRYGATAVPASKESVVFVRAYWRRPSEREKEHRARRPNSQRMVQKVVNQILSLMEVP